MFVELSKLCVTSISLFAINFIKKNKTLVRMFFFFTFQEFPLGRINFNYDRDYTVKTWVNLTQESVRREPTKIIGWNNDPNKLAFDPHWVEFWPKMLVHLSLTQVLLVI